MTANSKLGAFDDIEAERKVRAVCDAGTRKQDAHEDPYFVEVDQNGCTHCGAKRTWCVVGPDGCALSTIYEDEEDASDLACSMNEAYASGLSAGRQLRVELRNLLAEVMQKMRDDSGDASGDPMSPFQFDASWEDLATKADAAIAKATGESA